MHFPSQHFQNPSPYAIDNAFASPTRVNGYESAMPLPLSRPKKCQVIFPKNG